MNWNLLMYGVAIFVSVWMLYRMHILKESPVKLKEYEVAENPKLIKWYYTIYYSWILVFACFIMYINTNDIQATSFLGIFNFAMLAVMIALIVGSYYVRKKAIGLVPTKSQKKHAKKKAKKKQ